MSARTRNLFRRTRCTGPDVVLAVRKLDAVTKRECTAVGVAHAALGPGAVGKTRLATFWNASGRVLIFYIFYIWF